MPTWSPQRYRASGERQGVSSDVLDAAIRINQQIHRVDPRLPTILTLRHLSVLTDTPFHYLNEVVSRVAGHYKRVLFRKKVPGRTRYREIHIPEERLLSVQSWIAHNILCNTSAHPASFAYHPESEPVFAAKVHCPCRWLLKVDIEDFFHNISEGKIFLVFSALGYPRLLAFELARITTMVRPGLATQNPPPGDRWTTIARYRSEREGFLPQGAPTSPMLSNLVMKQTDERLATIATSEGLRYTRYADDLAFSADGDQTRAMMDRVKRRVLEELRRAGFKHNLQKTSLHGPGARRIVLGTLVDTDEPRLPREFKDEIRQHLYYLRSPVHGPAVHAGRRKMSVSTLYHHVRGKIAWAERVEPEFGAACLNNFQTIRWPPIDFNR